MSQHQFTTTRNARVEAAVAAVRKGRGVLVRGRRGPRKRRRHHLLRRLHHPRADGPLIRECSGIVCLCLPEDKVRQLDLPQMVANNTCKNRTAFTISIEAAEGVTTGVSAADRVKTIRTAIADDAVPGDLNHPGHVFPLCARSGRRARARRAHRSQRGSHAPCGAAALRRPVRTDQSRRHDGPAPRDHGLLPTARYARPPGTGLDRVHGTLTKETFP